MIFFFREKENQTLINNLDISYQLLEKIPKKYKENNLIIKYVFSCNNNNLTTLENIPKIIGSIDCSDNNLTSLDGLPDELDGFLICSNNNLTSLKGSPKKVSGFFYCANNNLTSLKDSPKIIKDSFNCKNNPKLKNIKQQIIENQIKALYYTTDEGSFYFNDIKKDFEIYKNKKINLDNLEQEKKLIKKNKKSLQKIDYGLGI